MKLHEFTIYYACQDDQLDDSGNLKIEVLEAIYEAGCDDATLVRSNGREKAIFSREGESFHEAVRSAIENLSSVPGLRIIDVEKEAVEDLSLRSSTVGSDDPE